MRDINAAQQIKICGEEARESTWYHRLHMSVIANKCYFVDGTVRLTGLHNFTICIHIKCTSSVRERGWREHLKTHIRSYIQAIENSCKRKSLPFKRNVFYGQTCVQEYKYKEHLIVSWCSTLQSKCYKAEVIPSTCVLCGKSIHILGISSSCQLKCLLYACSLVHRQWFWLLFDRKVYVRGEFCLFCQKEENTEIGDHIKGNDEIRNEKGTVKHTHT